MIDFAPAKINIGLHITGRRADGYHLLESLFVPIPLCDILELMPAPEGEGDSLTVLGDIDTGEHADNLVLRAVRALRAKFAFPFVSITLKKQIPSGAGMGGGSSDAACTLRMLRKRFALEVSDAELRAIALSLGADCPFFVGGEAAMVRGIGEVFSPAPECDWSPYHLVVVKPELHVSTAEAFRGLGEVGGHAEGVEEILRSGTPESWRGRLGNDFERSLFPKYPELSALKAKLYDLGAVYASMTGSGSALYGLFRRRLTPSERSVFADVFFWQGALDGKQKT